MISPSIYLTMTIAKKLKEILHPEGGVKYALDWLFLYLLVVAVVLFSIELVLHKRVNHHIIFALEIASTAVIFGYAVFFINGLYQTCEKWAFVRKHWMMALLIVFPFTRIQRFFPIRYAEHIFKISADSLWHLLEKFGKL